MVKVNKQDGDKLWHLSPLWKGGHWLHNYNACLEQKYSQKGTYFIEINESVNSTSLALDIICGSYICNDLQLMTRRSRMERGNTCLRMGNGARVATLAIWVINLVLDTDFKLVLNNCFFVILWLRILFHFILDKEVFPLFLKFNLCYF